MRKILIFPINTRESINYSIASKARGDYVIGATSETIDGNPYADGFVMLRSIFDDGFAEELQSLVERFEMPEFYTPSELIYQHVNSLGIVKMAEGSPIEILNNQYMAMEKTGLPVSLLKHASNIPGFMSEEKMSGMIDAFHLAPHGDAVEIGCAWGKSTAVMAMLCDGIVYAHDPFDQSEAYQREADPIVNAFTAILNWPMIEKIFRSNMEMHSNVRIGGRPASCSVLHIDGNHDYMSVESDWRGWRDVLVDGGVLILDDIDWPSVAILWEEIKHNFDKTFIRGGALFARYKK